LEPEILYLIDTHCHLNSPHFAGRVGEVLTRAETAGVMTVVVPALAWFIPGAGHLIQKRWIRGVLLMISVVAMFGLGLAMQGHVYKPNGGDILDILGFVGDVGAGGLYILARANDWDRRLSLTPLLIMGPNT
jgi:hypothetical protein